MPNAVELVKQTGYSAAQSACQKQLLQGGRGDEALDALSLILWGGGLACRGHVAKSSVEFVTG